VCRFRTRLNVRERTHGRGGTVQVGADGHDS
jgi:hypothetical protein